jgi:hypothetical protein
MKPPGYKVINPDRCGICKHCECWATIPEEDWDDFLKCTYDGANEEVNQLGHCEKFEG